MKVIAFERSVQGTGASRRLRNSGKTPGIIYGGTDLPQAVELDHNALFHALKKEAFHSSILDIEVAGKVTKGLLRDFQMHPFKPLVLHIDFQRVDATQKVHVKIPLHFKGDDICPAVKVGGGVVNHISNEVEVTCLPADLPGFLEVDLSKLEIGQTLHAKDLALPAGVSLSLHVESENPAIVVARMPLAASATETAAPTAPAAPTATKLKDKEGKD